MKLTLEEVKLYLRVDNEEEDNLIETLVDSAYSYMNNAVDSFNDKYEKENFKSMCDIIILTLITEWYDTRIYSKDDRKDKVSHIVTAMIQQLQYGSYDED